VAENFATKEGELTLEGFLQLHQMEAEDNGGDSAELWITLNAMGYNALLEQDEASVFEIGVKAQNGSKIMPELKVSGLKSAGSEVEKAVVKAIMKNAKKANTVIRDRDRDVVIYREVIAIHHLLASITID